MESIIKIESFVIVVFCKFLAQGLEHSMCSNKCLYFFFWIYLLSFHSKLLRMRTLWKNTEIKKSESQHKLLYAFSDL